MMKPMTLVRAMALTSLQKRNGVRFPGYHTTGHLPPTHSLVPVLVSPAWFRLPAFVPPNSFIAFGLKCCHNDVHIIVPISQHALLVGGHHGVWRQPTDVKEGLRLIDLPNTS